MALVQVVVLFAALGVFLAPPSVAVAAERPVRIVALGDSLTAGFNLPAGACVAMNSGWDAHVAFDKFRNADAEKKMHFPGFHVEAVKMLIEDGNAIGIAVDTLSLDLSIRQRSNGQRSLDDFMQEMWRRYGKPGGARQGYVDRPYTMADAEATLAGITDARFARDFFDRYITGRELADYGQLLTPAGFLVRRAPRGSVDDVEVVPVESAGGTLTGAQRAFRDSWLGPK